MQIHIGRDGQALGTFDENEVRDGLATGRFLGSDLAWRDGMGDWQPLSSFSILNAPPALQQSSSSFPATTPILMSATPPKSGLALASMICGITAIPGCFLLHSASPVIDRDYLRTSGIVRNRQEAAPRKQPQHGQGRVDLGLYHDCAVDYRIHFQYRDGRLECRNGWHGEIVFWIYGRNAFSWFGDRQKHKWGFC